MESFSRSARRIPTLSSLRSRHADDGPEAVAATALIFLHEWAHARVSHTYDERIHADNYWRLTMARRCWGQFVQALDAAGQCR